MARIEIGLATGAPFRMFSAFDVDPADYMARFSEGLRLMQQVWTGPRVDLDGRFWQLAMSCSREGCTVRVKVAPEVALFR